MADYRRHYDEGPRRFRPGHERDWSDRAGDEVRSWVGDDQARQRRGNDERAEYADGYYAGAATGSYRTDDRPYHDRYRADRYRDDGYSYRDLDEARYGTAWSRPRHNGADAAADEYFRAAREQRDELLRYEAQSPGAEFEDRDRSNDDRDRYDVDRAPAWARRERGGYWRHYAGPRSTYAGRGPKDYQRSDDRVREEICDCMTDDPMLDASEITVQVSNGEVMLSGTVPSRDQKRRAEDVAERISGVKDVTNQLRISREADGHNHPAARPVTQTSGNGTPSKSTSGTST
jgi:osmotically-inducible protein OsmY